MANGNIFVTLYSTLFFKSTKFVECFKILDFGACGTILCIEILIYNFFDYCALP